MPDQIMQQTESERKFFKRLKRLFSTSVILRNVGGARLKVADVDHMQAITSRTLYDRYSRIHSTHFGFRQGQSPADSLAYQGARLQLFRDYDIMDSDAIINTALDIFSDETSVRNESGEVLAIESNDENIREILHNLFYDILNVEFNLWPWVRNMCKYGDFFLFLEITEKYGIVNVLPLSVYDTIRVEGENPQNPYEVYFQTLGVTTPRDRFENFEIAHFRLLSDANFLPYGKCLTATSYVEAEYGVKSIKDLSVGDVVWTVDIATGKHALTTVKRTVASGEKRILKVRTRHNELEASEQHPVAVFEPQSWPRGKHRTDIYSEGSIRYKPASELQIGDLLALSKLTCRKSRVVPLRQVVSEHNHLNWQANKACLPAVADKDFCRFLGFLYGDGWLTKKPGQYHVRFAQGLDEAQNAFYRALMTKYTGKECGFTGRTYKNGVRDTCQVGSRLLHEFLTLNGFSGTAHTKRLPEWLYECDEDIQLAFVRGLVDADGCEFVDKWNVRRYCVELCNEELLQDVRRLLRRLNVKVGHVNKRSNRDGYQLYFWLDGDRINGLQKWASDEITVERVLSIAYAGKQETYDIQVDSPNNNFIANGIVVHNSMIEGARRTWKQLQLMEDAMLVHRLVRAPDRRVFKVDVGNINPKDIDAFMERMVSKMKKTPLIDPQTGDYNLKFNLQNIIEDFYIPVRGGDSGTKIENLQGLAFSAVDDVTYLRNKMIGALKVPRAFLGYEEQIGAKATLAAEDVRFARTIERIQRIVQSELTKIAIIHLYAQGYTDESLVNFSLTLTLPSTVYQQEKISLWTEKVKLAQEMQTTNLISSDWIYENILGFSEEEMENQRLQLIVDKKRHFRLISIETGQDPANPDGTGGEPGEKDTPGEPKKPDANRPKAGRPGEPNKYSTDRHKLGRDPLGDKENHNVLKPTSDRSLKKKLSREALDLQHFVKGLKAKFPVAQPAAVLTEGTFLDQDPPELEKE